MNQPCERIGADAAAGLHRSLSDTGERDSARFRLGLGVPRRTLAEVAEILALSPECIARLEQSALAKLRCSVEARRAGVGQAHRTGAAT